MTAVDIDLDMTVLEDMDVSIPCQGLWDSGCENKAIYYRVGHCCGKIVLCCEPCKQKALDWYLDKLNTLAHCTRCHSKFLVTPETFPKYIPL